MSCLVVSNFVWLSVGAYDIDKGVSLTHSKIYLIKYMIWGSYGKLSSNVDKIAEVATFEFHNVR